MPVFSVQQVKNILSRLQIHLNPLYLCKHNKQQQTLYSLESPKSLEDSFDLV